MTDEPKCEDCGRDIEEGHKICRECAAKWARGLMDTGAFDWD